MAVTSVRALLRDATAIFESMERDREPVLITRRGRPVAALVPVDSEQAEAMILSSVPGLIESRDKAENAKAEGRTTSLEDALRGLDTEESVTTSHAAPDHALGGTSTKQSDLVPAAGHRLPELTYLLGMKRAEEVNQAASTYVHQITFDALNDAAKAGLLETGERQNLADRIEQLNSRLFILKLRRELVRDLLERLAAITSGTTPLDQIANPTEGLFGKALTDAALGEASTFVGEVNTRSIARSKSPEVFEASLAASVGALELSDPGTK